MSSWVQYFHNLNTVTGNGVSSYITKYITDPEYERSIFY